MLNETGSFKLLLIDIESQRLGDIERFLSLGGFLVHVLSDLNSVFEQISAFQPDMIICEIGVLPFNGRELVRQLRRIGDLRPIILLTTDCDATERAIVLEEGADDVLNKPIVPFELMARVRAILRRVSSKTSISNQNKILHCGELTYDQRTRRAKIYGNEIECTPRALSLLEYLLAHAGEIVTREQLLDDVWGWDYAVGTRTVDTRITELRRALNDNAHSPDYIETVRGIGYRLLCPSV